MKGFFWKDKSSSEACWHILTPDLNLYEEVYDDPEMGPADFNIKGIDFKFYSRLPSSIYRFTDDPSEDVMKRFMNEAIDEMAAENIDEMAAETIGQGE